CVLLQVPLVEQHYFTEFWKFLKHKHNVERVSGDSQLKISFIETDQKNSIIICTSQILENYLKRPHSGDDDGIQLSGHTSVQAISVCLIKFTREPLSLHQTECSTPDSYAPPGK
uniref:Uncharacterized protein n=1 Tax=Hucho hucho TaxID=62062 RepID=A0A4W5RWR4_9TELE